jgi:Holliday junction resolvasome RuvABC endonuclease subunit
MQYVFNNLKGSVQRVKRTFVAVVLAVVFVLALAAPALAQVVFHTATYEMEGVIDFKKQAGHYCNTGAEFKQTISGSGKMDKVQTVTMVKGKITMDDKNDWVAGATPLTVTSVWKLCTPPKYTYYDADPDIFHGGDGTWGFDIPVSIASIYHPTYNMPAYWSPLSFDDPHAKAQLGYTHEQLAAVFGWDAVSEQYWAVQVQADPGFSGNIHQKGEAAYGPFWGADGVQAFDDSWREGGVFKSNNKWRWALDRDGYIFPQTGKNYVGDYFNMEQMARTSQGTLKRYIDISSPWSGGYLHEDMSVVGKSMVAEAFKLVNLPAGADIPGDWWRLF